MSTPRCAVCYGEIFRPVVAWGRTFCEPGCSLYFRTHFPNLVAAYDATYPRSAR